jgi:hypothetical protein
MKDVIVALPFGDSMVIEVHSKSADNITEEMVKKAFQKNKSLKLVSFEKTVVDQQTGDN